MKHHTQRNGSNKNNKSQTKGTTVWDSGLTVIDEPQIIVPEEVRRICEALQKQVGERKEVGILFKGEWTDNGYKLLPDYIVPEQTVSPAHINFDEDLSKYRADGYEVHVHSHPMNSGTRASFSGTDDKHSNSHFKAALIMTGDFKFGAAKLNIEPGGNDTSVKLQMEPDIVHKEPEPDLPDINTEPVNERVRRQTATTAPKRKNGEWTKEDWKEQLRDYRHKYGEQTTPEDKEEFEAWDEDWEQTMAEHYDDDEQMDVEKMLNYYAP